MVPATQDAAGQRRPDSVRAPRGEIKALTGMRAIAAMWVVLYHVAWLSSAYLDQLSWIRPVLQAGWTGVELFFVLSGFVIARSYLDEMGTRWRTAGVLRFWLNRVARIWPAYALVTTIAFAWLFVIGRLGWAVDVVAPHPSATLGELARQFTMTQMWGESTLTGQSFDPPGWSISAEWLAYLAFPLLALLARPLRRLHLTVLLGASCAAMLPLFLESYLHGTPDVATNWLLRISCCFVAGILACLGARKLECSARAEQWGLVLSVTSVIGVVTMCFWATWRSAFGGGGQFAGVATILFPLLIAGLAVTTRGPARWLAAAPLVYGGRVSYCLYLAHFVVMDIVVTWFWQDESVRGSVPPSLALAIPILVLLSLAAGAALHHAVEEPARRQLLRLFSRRLAAATPGERRPEVVTDPSVAAPPARASLASRVSEPQTARLTVDFGKGVVVGRPRPTAPRHLVDRPPVARRS